MTDTKYKVMGEICYSARLHERHTRFFSRIRAVTNYLNILSGTAVFISATHGAPIVTATVGGVIVCLSLADQVWNYGSLASRHAEARKECLDLISREASMEADALKAENIAIDARFCDLNEIESLRDVAQNDVLRELGHTNEMVPETLCQRAMRTLA